jgi:hypothetical protein
VTKKLLIVVFSLLALTSLVRAQLVTGRFSTAVYTFEKFDSIDISRTIARGYQTFQLNITEGDVSVQTSVYGAATLSKPYYGDGIIRMSNLLLRWRNIANAVDASFGRVPIFAGVGIGTVDGALVKMRTLESKLILIGYGGANVRPALKSSGTENLSNNFMIGGQIVGSVGTDTRLSLSYVNRRIQRDEYTVTRFDSLSNPVSVFVSPDARAEQTIGFDARYDDTQLISVYGRYDYNMNAKRNLRLQLSSRLTASEEVGVTVDYVRREPRLSYSSWFNIFPMSAINEIEGGVEYGVSSSTKVYGKFGYVKYIDASTNRFTFGAFTEYGSVNYSGSTGYAGVLNSVSAQCMYPLLERKLIPTVGLSYASYKLDENSKQESVFAGSLGAIARPTQTVSIDIQAQWLTNKVLKNDVRLLAKVDYWFNYNLNLFTNKGTEND